MKLLKTVTVLLLALHGAHGQPHPCFPCCTGGEENCEVAGCVPESTNGLDMTVCDECDYMGEANKPESYIDCFRRRKLRAGGRKTLMGSIEPEVTLADGCCWYAK